MMMRYIARRLALLFPVLLGISIFIFSLIRFAPGDPIYMALGQDYDPELARQMEQELGLDKPILEQYFWWLGKVLRGDLGRSIVGGDPQPIAQHYRPGSGIHGSGLVDRYPFGRHIRNPQGCTH
jgi:peptide/nickel transport system permease protein